MKILAIIEYSEWKKGYKIRDQIVDQWIYLESLDDNPLVGKDVVKFTRNYFKLFLAELSKLPSKFPELLLKSTARQALRQSGFSRQFQFESKVRIGLAKIFNRHAQEDLGISYKLSEDPEYYRLVNASEEEKEDSEK